MPSSRKTRERHLAKLAARRAAERRRRQRTRLITIVVALVVAAGGLSFLGIAKNFVIQGGDPTGTGSGGPGYKTLDVPPNGTMYPKGTVAMAKGGNEPAGTAGSQFFIVTGDAATLPADYAVIGVVTSGLDVASKIEALDIVGGATDGMPVQKVYIDKVTTRVL